jgi:hypothetical protein
VSQAFIHIHISFWTFPPDKPAIATSHVTMCWAASHLHVRFIRKIW